MPNSETDAPDLRAWLGVDPPAWPAVQSLDDGAAFEGCFYVAEIRELRTRSDKPYLRIQLYDRNGPVDGRVWDDTDQVVARVEDGCFVGVRGRVQIYKGTYQLKIESIDRLHVSPEEKALFMPRSERAQDEMEGELDRWIASVDDVPLRTLLETVLGGDSPTGRRFRYSPAAKRNHHAYVGGLLEHTLSVTGVCERLARHYGARIDRDLLITGALLHDLGKIEEIATETGFPYTDEGKLLGHILLGLRIVEDAGSDVAGLERDRLALVLHLIASHQGRFEWQSPREPRTLEALLLHYADDLDAKMQQAIDRVERADPGDWSDYDRSFGREFLRHGGRSAAVEAVEAGESVEAAGPGDRAEVREVGEIVTGVESAQGSPAPDAPENDGRTDAKSASGPADDTLELFPE